MSWRFFYFLYSSRYFKIITLEGEVRSNPRYGRAMNNIVIRVHPSISCHCYSLKSGCKNGIIYVNTETVSMDKAEIWLRVK